MSSKPKPINSARNNSFYQRSKNSILIVSTKRH